MVKYAKFDKISNEKLKQFGGKNDVSKNEKFSFAPPPLYKCIVVLLAAAAFILTACSGLQEDGGEKNIRINLPPIVSASGNSRALSGDRLPTLKTETRRYRVTVNGIVREGTGSSYEFRLAVGIRATAIIECLNSSGEVIIRAVKDFTVSGGENSIDINLKNDGNEIIPSAPQPVPGQVTYTEGGANVTNMPSDTTTYNADADVTLDTTEPTRNYYTFAGWTANVALKGKDASGGDVNIPPNTPFVSTSTATSGITQIKTFAMPNGGIVLTAQWTPITYKITYDTNGGTGSADTTGATTSFNIETQTITFASEGTLEKIAYAFDGWETTSGTPVSGKNASELIALITSGDTLELQVKWIDGKRTVLYSDGTLIINELPTARRTDTPTAVYAAMKDDGSNYIFTGTADIPWYNNKDSIFSVEIGSTIQPTSTKVWFAYLEQCISMDLENLDTSRVTNMDQMFRQCQKMTNLDLSSFDTSNVTDMSNMFYACGNTLVNLNVNSFDTSKVTAMNAMFASCSGLTNLDVSNFNTSKVTTMYNMFSDCSSLTTLDLHNFDISSATIFYMFNGCTSLTSLDISNFDTSKITDMQSLFAYCSNLKTIYASSSFITDNVTNDAGMFSNCTSLVGGQGTAFDANNPTDKTYARIDGGTSSPGYFTQKP